MTDERRFEELLAELERVGVDPHSFPAGIEFSREDALRVLRTLPEGAGPAAFLAAIRSTRGDAASNASTESPSHSSSSP